MVFINNTKKTILLVVFAAIVLLFAFVSCQEHEQQDKESTEPVQLSSQPSHDIKEAEANAQATTFSDMKSGGEEVKVKRGKSKQNITVDPNETIFIEADWFTSRGKNRTTIKVNKLEHLTYKFRPMVIGEAKAIKLLNAKVPDFYYRKLENPISTLWLLSIGGRGKRPIKWNYTMKRIYERAFKMNIQVEVKETHLFDLVVSQEGMEQLIYKGEPIQKLPDAVLSRLGAKIDYFGLAVVRHLEKIDVLVLNNHLALETSRDKLHTLQDLAAQNMPIPKTMIAKFPVDLTSIQREFQFPMILKHSSGTQGKGVMLIENMQHLNGLSDMVDVSKPMIFQEFVANSIGRDIRVIVVGGKVVGAMMRVAKSGFKANFHQGGYVKKIKISKAIEWLALESARIIGLEVAGVDILIDKNTYKICEINSSPGFQGFEMATEVDVPYQILDFVKLRTGVWKKSGKPKKVAVVVPVQEDIQTLTSDSPVEESYIPSEMVKDEL